MQNQSQKSIFEKLFDLSIGISCMIILVVAVVSVGSSIMVPKNDVELMQAWEKSYNRMCTKIMKDAEKGKEKEVTEYRMYYLVKGDYWGNLEKEMFYYEAQSASMELNMGLRSLYCVCRLMMFILHRHLLHQKDLPIYNF